MFRETEFVQPFCGLQRQSLVYPGDDHSTVSKWQFKCRCEMDGRGACPHANLGIANIRKVDFNTVVVENLMDSYRKIGVSRYPVG